MTSGGLNVVLVVDVVVVVVVVAVVVVLVGFMVVPLVVTGLVGADVDGEAVVVVVEGVVFVALSSSSCNSCVVFSSTSFTLFLSISK